MSNAEAELIKLRQLVQIQQAQLKTLQQQLEFVLSFLDIKGTEEVRANATAPSELVLSTDQGADVGDILTSDGKLWTEVVSRKHRPKRPDTSQHTTSLPGVDAVSDGHRGQHTQPLHTLKESLVAAVYIDQSNQKRRPSSLIVSGLQPDNSQSDLTLFNQLVNNEFGMQPDTAFVRRLGQPQLDRIQPLLVILRNTDQAQHNSARQLRQSTNPRVRDRIYINPNLTKAEAAAAYQLRVQRSQAAQRRAQ
jgi:hypothetical protein